MKKILIGAVIVLSLIISRYSLYVLLFHEGVSGTKLVSPLVSGGLLFNGFHYLVLDEPIVYLGNKPEWKTCLSVSDTMKSVINTFSDGKEVISNSREIMYEYSPDIVKLYIKQSNKVILLDAFADYGGVIGLSPEAICNQWKH